jgi:GGDEF-like domain/PucR C-terminal helix-turn-helix domain
VRDQPDIGLVEHLQLRRSEIEGAIFAHIRGAVPDHLGDEDAEYVVGLRAAVTAAIDYSFMGIEREDSAQPPIPLSAVSQAALAARRGVGLDTVLLRYIAGYTLLIDFMMEEADRVGSDGRRLRWLRRRQSALLGRLTATIVEEYQRAREQLERSPNRRLEDQVQRLLAGEPADSAEFKYDLEAWHLAVIATGGEAARAVVRQLAAELGHDNLVVCRSEDTAWAWFGGQRKQIVTDIVRRLLAKHHTGVSLAVGEPARGSDGFCLTHRQAQAALLVALRKPQQLTRYADVALLAFALRDEMLARSVVDIYLAPLDGSGKSSHVLRQTLHAYFAAERNASSAAAALGVARHTIENRLRKVEERLDRRLASCLAELEVSLRVEDCI